jgi:hypothetical protein
MLMGKHINKPRKPSVFYAGKEKKCVLMLSEYKVFQKELYNFESLYKFKWVIVFSPHPTHLKII